MNTTFSCVGCGKCCNDHHVPLTLPEARMWAADGGQVIVLVEAFLGRGLKGTQALVILARKLTRVVFALMKNQSEHPPNSMFGGSPKT